MANEVKGTALQLDVTAEDAGRRIVEHATTRHGGLDIVVHNAGITRDKLFVNMDDDRWHSVMEVNLRSILRMNEAILGDGGLSDGGRIVCVRVDRRDRRKPWADELRREQGRCHRSGLGTFAPGRGPRHHGQRRRPGFIETEMTARIPFATREIGRRMNSLQQGGHPKDVAETIAWFAQPGAAAVTGQVVRVCGQSLLGA